MWLRFFAVVSLTILSARAQTPPTLSALDPAQVEASDAAFSLTVLGRGFTSDSVVMWAGTPLSTAFDSDSHLTAAAPAGLAGVSGKYEITVVNSSGAASNPAFFFAQPAVYAVEPSAARLGGGDPVAITVSGSGFLPTDLLILYAAGRQWTLPTSLAGPSALTGAIPAAALAAAGAASVYVLDTAGGSFSRPLPFTIAGDVPGISGVNPAEVAAGGPGFTLTVAGSDFQPGAVVRWNGVPLATAFVNSARLTAEVTSPLIAAQGEAAVEVSNPGGSSSPSARLLIDPPLTTLRGCVPPAPQAGGFVVTAFAERLLPDAVLLWNGSLAATSSPATGQLSAAIPPDRISASDAGSLTAVSGGVSSTCVAVAAEPSPSIFSALPSEVDATSASLTITLSGAGFVEGASASLGAAALTVVYENSGRIGVLVPGGLLAAGGTQLLSVATPGGAVSNSVPISVRPVLTRLTPDSGPVGGPSLVVTATGAGFTPSHILVMDRAGVVSDLDTTYAGPATLTAVLPAAALAAAVRPAIRVSDSSHTVFSRALLFAVGNAPEIGSLAPDEAAAGSPAFTLTVSGSGFAAGSVVQWNGSPLATTVLGDTRLAAAAPAALLTRPGRVTITVFNPGGSVSNALQFIIRPAPPVISAVSPAAATAGGPALVLTVHGSGYLAEARLQWNGVPLQTTSVQPGRLTASVPAGLLAESGTATIVVVNGDGSASETFAYSVRPAAPSIRGCSPRAAAAGGPGISPVLYGSGFLPGAIVRWNDLTLQTTYLDPTRLIAVIPASVLAAPLSGNLTVLNPGGAASNPFAFTVSPAGPLISALSPDSAAAGGSAITLTVNGSGFNPDTTLRWNGTLLETLSSTPSRMAARIPPELLGRAGMAGIIASGPGGISNTLLFVVTPPETAPAASRILNTGSLTPAIAPGCLISIFGKRLASDSRKAGELPAPGTLGGTSVLIDGRSAPLLFVSPEQINAQVPFETSEGTVTLLVEAAGGRSAPALIEVSKIAPAVLTSPESGRALAVNLPDGTLNSPDNRARPGQFVTVYLTGQGPVDYPVATGAAAGADPLSRPLETVRARLAGKPAEANAALAPGTVGILQLNLLVPDVPAGEQTLEISIGVAAAPPVALSIAAN